MGEYLVMVGTMLASWGILRMLLGWSETKNIEKVQEEYPNVDVDKYKALDNQSKIGLGIITVIAGVLTQQMASWAFQMATLITLEVVGIFVYYWYRKRVLAGK